MVESPLLLRTDVFIVRVWQEPRVLPAAVVWRGVVEHVPSGRRRYFVTLEEAVAFITEVVWPKPD